MKLVDQFRCLLWRNICRMTLSICKAFSTQTYFKLSLNAYKTLLCARKYIFYSFRTNRSTKGVITYFFPCIATLLNQNQFLQPKISSACTHEVNVGVALLLNKLGQVVSLAADDSCSLASELKEKSSLLIRHSGYNR